MRHLLKKQVLDLKISNSLDAFPVQHNMSGHYWKYILPILEKIFDELGDSNLVIKIDSLEIDLGTFSKNIVDNASWDATFIMELQQKLRRGIQSALEQKKNMDEPREMVLFSQWLYYMKNGFLPWNSVDLKADITTILETLATDYASITEVRTLLLTNKVARRRIVFQHKEDFLQNLVTVLTSKKQEGLSHFVDEISRVRSAYAGQKSDNALPAYRIKYDVWHFILLIAARYEQLALDEIKQHVHLKYNTALLIAPESAPGLKSIAPSSTDDSGRTPGSSAEIENLSPKNSQNDVSSATEANGSNIKKENGTNLLGDNEVISINESSSGVKNAAKEDNSSIAEESEIPEPPQNDMPELEEGIFINLAGLALVHPFLSTLFKKLKWVANGKFTNLENQQRGLYLLNYIGSGSSEADEHDLISCKVLCAYPLLMPVPKNIDIDTEAIREADNMLEALIAQWGILKQTSPDGLRQGFLQRNGKLFWRNDRMCLQVESKAIDVLLDRLPWNLSIIKLPWMQNIMTIEWR